MADSQPTPVKVRTRATLTKYDVGDDGTRTVAEVVTMLYEDETLVGIERRRGDGTIIEEETPCRS